MTHYNWKRNGKGLESLITCFLDRNEMFNLYLFSLDEIHWYDKRELLELVALVIPRAVDHVLDFVLSDLVEFGDLDIRGGDVVVTLGSNALVLVKKALEVGAVLGVHLRGHGAVVETSEVKGLDVLLELLTVLGVKDLGTDEDESESGADGHAELLVLLGEEVGVAGRELAEDVNTVNHKVRAGLHGDILVGDLAEDCGHLVEDLHLLGGA
mgnify:CR=1 FL=1